jgi:hypothetical protein
MKGMLAYTALAACFALAQAQSPADQASVTVGGKTITIKYSAPSVRGRQVFGDGGIISNDPNYPVWRAGANEATALHTDADLQVGSLLVPKGDYTLYVLLKAPGEWELILNKQTGQWGLTYDKSKDLGRVPMTMSKPPALVERLKYDLAAQGANKVKLTLSWENHVGSVTISVK